MLAIVAGAARADNSPDAGFIAPAAPTAPAGPAAAAAPAAPPRVWVWMERSLPVSQAATIRTAPSDSADAAGQVATEQSIFVVGMLQDRDWLQVQRADSQAPGYVHAATVAADEPPPPGKPAPLPISGRPTVHDTATLVVEDHVVPLAGVVGYGGALADGLQHYLDANGAFVLCSQVTDATYRCTTRDNVDVASVALVNGAARMTDDAPPAAAVQQRAAQQNQRGIWAPQADAQPAPPPPPPPVLPDWETEFYLLHPVVPLDPGGADAAVAGDPGYGAVLIDGELVTVVGGARVALWHDPGRGWGFRDHDGHWRPPPPRLDRALDRHYGARPPDFAGHEGRPHELGGVRDVAFARHAGADLRGQVHPDLRAAAHSDTLRDPRLNEARPGPQPGIPRPLAAPRAVPAARPSPAPRFGAPGYAARAPAPVAPGTISRGAPGYVSRTAPIGGPSYASRFGAGAPRAMPGFYAPGIPAGRFSPGVSPTPNAALRMGMVAGAPRIGAPPMMGMRPPGGIPQRPTMPTINRAVAPHPATCRKPPC